MRFRSTSALVFLAIALSGCEEALPPATTLATSPEVAGPRQALVTFVRPVSSCDTGEYAVVVDDKGHFVANVASGTNVSYPTSSGIHVFYAWSNVELVVQSNPNFSAVGAVRVRVDEAGPNYVVINASAPCQARLLLEINSVRAMRDPVAGEAEVTSVLPHTTAVSADRVAGQALLDAHPARTHFQMELGKMTLRRRDLNKASENGRPPSAVETPPRAVAVSTSSR